MSNTQQSPDPIPAEISIQEGNRLIAEFSMVKRLSDSTYSLSLLSPTQFIKQPQWFKDEELEFHTSWDWLMPVVEKVESIYDDFHGYFGVHISSNSCTIQGTKLNTTPENFHAAYLSDPNAILSTKIESTWYNIVEFIKWYNQNTNK